MFNLKTILVGTLCITGAILFVTSCAQKNTADTEEIAVQENIAALESGDQKTIVVVENDNDASFLMEASAMQLEEVSLGKLAQQKGTNSHVKKLGKMMENDHNKIYNELKVLAQAKSIAIPSAITEDSKDTFEDLNEKSGNDFGKTYSEMMVEHHEDAITLFEKTSTDSEDPEIKTWAASKLAGLRTHLKHAEACKKECDKM